MANEKNIDRFLRELQPRSGGRDSISRARELWENRKRDVAWARDIVRPDISLRAKTDPSRTSSRMRRGSVNNTMGPRDLVRPAPNVGWQSVREPKSPGGLLSRYLEEEGAKEEGQRAFSPSSPAPQEVPAVEESLDGFDSSSMAFLNKQMDRLGIPEDQREAFSKNMYDWSRQVRNVESDNNPLAAAGTTSAKGVYQFTDDSVNTGKNRMANLGFDDEFTGGISSNPQEWSDEQADSMFLANMFAQKGSDEYLSAIGGGDEQARQDAYYKFHHTAPDEATKRRVGELMPYSNQPVDDTMANYNNVNKAFTF